MKILTIFNQLDKAFDSRVRICIMSILDINKQVDFKAIKQLLDLTDGNLASHINALEKYDYIKVHKQFIGKRPNTSYSMTKEGREAFHDHAEAIKALLSKTRSSPAE